MAISIKYRHGEMAIFDVHGCALGVKSHRQGVHGLRHDLGACAEKEEGREVTSPPEEMCALGEDVSPHCDAAERSRRHAFLRAARKPT